MAKAPTLNDITNVYTSAATINSNNNKVEQAFENTLSRDGSGPNQMLADLDMNSNDILNVNDLDVGGRFSINGVPVGIGDGTSLARDWANAPEDVEVDPDNFPDEYSSFHWAQKAEEAAELAESYASQAYTFATLDALLATEQSFSLGTVLNTRREGYSYVVVNSNPSIITQGGMMLRVPLTADRVTPQMFGAIGDGTTNDTDSWNAFQSFTSGKKDVPAGRYLVNGSTYRFDQGVLGNGVFNDSTPPTYDWGYWSQVWGDRERDAILVHSRTVDANSTLTSPMVKLQSKIQYNNSNPATASASTLPHGVYVEGIGEGDYAWDNDGATINFTTLAATAHNKFAGQAGMTAVTGRVWDATEDEVPTINTLGASKSCGGYFPFVRRSRFDNGGYMMGIETYCQNSSPNEGPGIPYYNSDSFQFETDKGKGWTAGYHCTMIGGSSTRNGAPITAGIFMDGANAARYGCWNGIVLGGSAFPMTVDGVRQGGVEGTVGLTMASWTGQRFADTGIKFRKANRHMWFVEGAKIRSTHSRFIYEDGAAVVSIDGQSGTASTLNFRVGVTSAPDGGSPTIVGRVRASGGSGLELISDYGRVGVEVNGNAFNFLPSGFQPASDAIRSLGGAANRWSQVYASNGSINTSDERLKQDILPIDDAALDAWGDVNWSQFKFRDAVAEKGEDARNHTGLIAQHIRNAFVNRGLDATKYGVLCYDEWDEVQEVTRTEQVRISEEEIDEDGEVIVPAVYEEVTTVEVPYRAAGNLYSVRYEEALSFEAAYQRRRAERVEERLNNLESRLAAAGL